MLWRWHIHLMLCNPIFKENTHWHIPFKIIIWLHMKGRGTTLDITYVIFFKDLLPQEASSTLESLMVWTCVSESNNICSYLEIIIIGISLHMSIQGELHNTVVCVAVHLSGSTNTLIYIPSIWNRNLYMKVDYQQ